MITTTLQIYNEKEYTYPIKGGFIPTIHTYIHHEGVHDAILIVPGGGYSVVTPAEAEVVALKFYNRNFNVFVLTYTINFTHTKPLNKQPIKDASRAVRVIRNNAKDFQITDKVYGVGFSVGCHILTMLCEDYDKGYLKDEVFLDSNKLDKLILCYPLLDVSTYANTTLGENLLGKGAPEYEYDDYNAIKGANSSIPPIYMWNTAEDTVVSARQPLDFIEACEKNNVEIRYHLYPHGPHGMSVADEDWALGRYGEPYTIEQIITEVCAAIEND